MIVNQAYRFALDPNATQVAALASHAGASRKAFNWALGLVKAQMDQRAAEKTYGLTGDQLTPAVSWTLPSLRKAWNEAKGDVAPWWAENSKEAYAAGIRNLVRGLDAWRDSKSGKRKGPKVSFPRFKGKRTRGEVVHVHHRRHPDRGGPQARDPAPAGHDQAARVGPQTGPAAGRGHRPDPVRDGEAATVAAGSCRSPARSTGRSAPTTRPDAVVGVDVGIKHLAVLSTGEVVDNPRHLAGASKHLRRLSRRVSRRIGPDRRTRQEASKRWLKANADRSRAYARVANLRRDGLHKLTTDAGRRATARSWSRT